MVTERKRRPKGSGSISQRQRDGRWVAYIPLGDGRRKVITSATRDELISRLGELGMEESPGNRSIPRQAVMDAARAMGKHTEAEWSALVRLSPATCPYCDVRMNIFNDSKDHVTPVSRGGSDAIDNLQRVCWQCNLSKGAQTADEYIYDGPRPRSFRPHPRREEAWLRVIESDPAFTAR